MNLCHINHSSPVFLRHSVQSTIMKLMLKFHINVTNKSAV